MSAPFTHPSLFSAAHPPRPPAHTHAPIRPPAGGKNKLVLCECYAPDMTPIPTNTRYGAAKIFSAKTEELPWFGLEQEYTLFNIDKVTPLGWPKGGYPGPQGPYYCGACGRRGRRVTRWWPRHTGAAPAGALARSPRQ